MLVSPAILWTLIFLFWFWQMLLPTILGNLILFVADVIAIGFCNLHLFGWCCCHVALLYDKWWCNYHQAVVVACLFVLADVNCHLFFVTVGIARFLIWVVPKVYHCCSHCFFVGRCYCQDGWRYCHCLCLADVIATRYYSSCWQMLLPGGWWNAYHGCGWLMLLPMW